MKEKLESLRRSLSRRFSVKKLESVEGMWKTFSPAERVLWWLLVAGVVTASFVALNEVNKLALVEVPDRGGSLIEGSIGSPRFINPLLAISDADRDLTSLVYSGLLRVTAEGELIPDLAESYTISPDGLIYTVKLRQDALFQDNMPVTADDALFTADLAKDSAIKSPKRPNWDGIAVEKVDRTTLRFTLRQPYAPFLENLTLGILPKHLWSSVTPEEFSLSSLNIEPIGSGPYQVSSVKRNNDGIPTRYELTAFGKFTLGEGYLSRLTIRFYGSEDDLISAWNHGEIESISGISSGSIAKLTQDARIERAPLPRVFAVFMNQNQAPIFAHKEVRQALDRALGKEKLVNDVLKGYGTILHSPIPPGTFAYSGATIAPGNIEEAKDILRESGWIENPETKVWEKKAAKKNQAPEKLQFSLATPNAPELKEVAEIIKKDWELLGAKVDLHIYETGDLQQNVIRPRKYDTLLFGEIVGRELDLFAFWDSSQRNDPGLNVALYTSSAADKLLESGRALSSEKERIQKYRAFEKEVVNDIGAIFLYAPDFLYLVPKDLQGFSLGSITTPSDRFSDIYKWYTQTNQVWHFFAR
ncbi:hypothetical protein A2761_03115 [Candidatus Kaiserbacteria bacterium RIFCSPHIGHO2_01_FULL_51_33]|uniref:Solute-binding protein family 5 domain-containing protein n=1 Tax=Candidatus Kaiserbacteria bacterium RIFCSPLOWO2_01_FULL_51_21 TaxID=1798508 RepID=A0A1F6EEE3_9BACT|nr:MAG: hypothetical protein A2761_03115 [Candidatus Kaiserbacteria bacterium RIFCSPHIGHO2_01_FULL_51_33]OGG72031.1 MAG: hypothetical protein A3A35_01035 [Candidatus Kaiserbacteria bacterium RIFCSPLOWO2_01_FULL_51_21]